jgi:acetolactate synthase I/II/III large subunit
MTFPLDRRELLKTVAAGAALAALPRRAAAGPLHPAPAGWVTGHLTGAQALVEALLHEGVGCVFGIPGAQENELWDAMKAKHLGYLLVTHEFSAAAMADGYARSTGKPGVLCVVPGPGLTNALSGIGEALLDSVPLVCVVGDVARGDKYHAFQVHDLPQVGLLQQVTKGVFEVKHVGDIPCAVGQAFRLAEAGEPGPAAVVVPYNLLLESHKYTCPPAAPLPVPHDEEALQRAVALLSDRKLRVGIYAGQGCMDYSCGLVQLAELLQAPVATSVSGKGAMPDGHPLAVGYGYGGQGSRTAELLFANLDLVLAVGVRYSEVSTAFYAIPKHRHVIHVDVNPHNLGRIVKTDVCVVADAGVFFDRLTGEYADLIRRPCDPRVPAAVARLKAEDFQRHAQVYAKCGADPMTFLLTLRRLLDKDALTFVDVTQAEHWAAEAFPVWAPRTYFNPTDNQAMGWSVPAAMGAQRAFPCRQVVTVTGDGCFLMSAVEISTAAREGLPVKFFVLDDQAYHYMQTLQKAAYLRTTATVLARLDYAALAQAFGVAYQEIRTTADLEPGIRGALCQPGPVLVRVVADYGKRPVRWIDATRKRFTQELTPQQKTRFLARIGARALSPSPNND